MSAIPSRIERLRARLRELGWTHYLVPSSDEHLNEYLPPCSLRRQWMSGFTGSAGDLLIGVDPGDTRLFVDGRYHVQAEAQLAGSTIEPVRVGLPGVPTLSRYVEGLAQRHGAKLRIGVDPFVLARSTWDRLVDSAGAGSLVAGERNLVDVLWTDRAAPARDRLEELPAEITGATAHEKLSRLKDALKKRGASSFVTVKLDQIAWLLNLRSLHDVPYNPVFLAYLIVESERTTLFVAGGIHRIPDGLESRVPGLCVRDYHEFHGALAKLPAESISIDPDRTTAGIFDRLNRDCRVLEHPSPVESMKARKNATEIAQMRAANLAASAAKTRAIVWAKRQIDRGEILTERSFKDYIEARYSELPDYRALSFSTISAAGDHAALPHYGGVDDTPLREGDFFVIDSGIQIGAGTTDDTRTLGIGTPTEEKRRIFTLVLKAHIQGAAAVFPEGTAGASIDALTRNPLWAHGLDYGHGTGHGVGAFLNVHEGPFQIGDLARRPSTTIPLEPGMITSIEPGYYRLGLGGVRHENLYLVVEHHLDDAGRRWLSFEPLTFIPFDVAWLDFDALDARERDWLDRYHDSCRVQLERWLEPHERSALDELLRPANGHAAL